jgi:cysteine synthase A
VHPERKELYNKIGKNIGQTPLYEIKSIPIPNGNRIFAKEEYLNPTGSHYDRVFWRLLFSLESEGRICPCQKLVETTSGNAGASFAWLSDALGYRAAVVIPEDMPSARVAQIKSFGAQIVLSPPGEYVVGAIGTLRKYLTERKSEGELVYCTNHAEQEASIAGMSVAADEIRDEFLRRGIAPLDFYVSALGGGIALRGVTQGLKNDWPELKVYGVEPIEAPEYYFRKHPQGPGFSFFQSVRPHDLIGIGRWGDDTYKFQHMEKMLSQIEEVVLVRKEDWLQTSRELRDVESKHVGRTSAASLWATLELAKRVSNKSFLIIFYDPAWKYLNIT